MSAPALRLVAPDVAPPPRPRPRWRPRSPRGPQLVLPPVPLFMRLLTAVVPRPATAPRARPAPATAEQLAIEFPKFAKARSIATAPLSEDERKQLRRLPVLRPTNRGQCAPGGGMHVRPCPFVACTHHLYLEVNPDTGTIKIRFPGLEATDGSGRLHLERMPETCALDVAERGGAFLEEVGEILNLTNERVRQDELRGKRKIAASKEALHCWREIMEHRATQRGPREDDGGLDDD